MSVKPDGFVGRLLEKTPAWAVSACAVMLCFVISFKFMGLDLGPPLQQITDAYAKAISAQAEGMIKFDEATKRFELLVEEHRKSVDDMDTRVTEALAETSQAVTKLTESIEAVKTSIIQLETRVSALEKVAHEPEPRLRP